MFLEKLLSGIREQRWRGGRSDRSLTRGRSPRQPFSFRRLIGRYDAANDFAVVKLWYPHKEDAMGFCEQLWRAPLNELGLESKSPQEVLGDSVFQTSSESWKRAKTAYTSKSKIGKRFKSLAEKDLTFRKFLKDKQIDPENMDQLTGTQRPQTVRKVVSIAADARWSQDS